MRQEQASILGGLIGGAALSLLMELGRRAGLLHKTLAEDAEDWLDRTAATRRHLGTGGTTAAELANHMTASAVFGYGYVLLRNRAPALPAGVLGALYGAGLYAVNIASVAPLIGLTAGEQNAPMPVRAERLGLHLLYGVVTAIVAERLTSRSSLGPSRPGNA